MKQYIAYRGSEFTIEWYYDIKGNLRLWNSL